MSFIDYKHKKAQVVYTLTFESGSEPGGWYKIISNLSLLPIGFYLSYLSERDEKKRKNRALFLFKKT